MPLVFAAYCRNSVDALWYSYDDSSVDLVPEEEVCTRGAYILFYQRRNAIPQWSASSSIRGMHNNSVDKPACNSVKIYVCTTGVCESMYVLQTQALRE